MRDDRVGEPLKKRRRRERTSTSPSVDGAAAQLQEGEEVGWIDDEPRKMEREESKSVLGGHQYEGWEEEEDTVWVGFKEDCYRGECYRLEKSEAESPDASSRTFFFPLWGR